ncbi:MAG: asparagine synthase (glutamine-hydrolyzing) [Magnetococcales bacterium]|nr:asparagine synthase (glutamine-hydrolyzing) [Magnetococcales bacterium]
MCGIIGLFAHGDLERVWPVAGLDAMVAALGHRGPDGWGKFVEPGIFLGHTRLAILDLSAAGQQPMASSDGRYVICFNGEIYNFIQLRDNLKHCGHRFVTNTDTEVLLAAWVEWGRASLSQLSGIFAFALFDRREQTLFLVRDHLGVKPLFYWQGAKEIGFASEPLALFGPVIPMPEPDALDLDHYFTYNYLPAPASGLKNVRQLPPGHLLEISPQGESLHCYWQLTCPSEPLSWNTALIEQFQALLDQAVAAQLVSDAPLGLFLSGGLDSTAVALATHGTGQSLTTFTLGFGESGFDERLDAQKFAQFLGLNSQSVSFSWSEDEILTTLGVMRELMADASCFPMMQLARFARLQATVILAGDGGDELLAGYDTYKASQWTPYLRRIPLILRNGMLALTRFLPSDHYRYSPRMVVERLLTASAAGPMRDHVSFRRIFSDAMKQRLYDPEWFCDVSESDPVGSYASLMGGVPAERSYLTACQYADLHHFLPGVLAKVDRMSMANGLEVRVPLLDRALVEFCFQLPDVAKRYQGKGKRLLRETLVGRVPPRHLQKPKSGFLPPVEGWFRHSGPMSVVFGHHLDWARQNTLGWLKWDEVERVWREHQGGRTNAGFVLLGILQFINWHRQLLSTQCCAFHHVTIDPSL